MSNTGNIALNVGSLIDDAGTAAAGDDFRPKYVSGDTNGNNLLDPGETWLYTSAGATLVSTGAAVPTYAVKTGQFVNTAMVAASVPGTALTAVASNKTYLWGQPNGRA